jgi:surface carbohydrate biosynthesis protein
MIVAIPIEIKSRELYPKLLISYYLLKFNPKIKILLTKSSILMDDKIKKKKLIYFEKSLSKHKIKLHEKFLKKNFIVSLDEEGPFYHWSNILKNNRINLKIIKNKNFKFFFLWGENEKKYFKNEIFSTSKKKIIAVGHPKFDFVRKKNHSFFKKELSIIKKKYKNLIFVSSSFFSDSVMDERIYKIYLEKTQKDKKSIENFSRELKHHNENYFNLIKLSIEIAKKFPNHNVVFRPHPRQDINKVKSRFNEIPKNLHIVFKFTSTPWIIASKFYVHCNCTTVHEAYFLKKHIYCCRPNLKIFAKKHLTEYGSFFQSNKLLISDLSKKILNPKLLKKNIINQKIIKFSKTEESSKKIAKDIFLNFKNIKSEIKINKNYKKKNNLETYKNFFLSNLKHMVYLRFRSLYIFLFKHSLINVKHIFTKDYKLNKIKSLQKKDVLNFFKKLNKKEIKIKCKKINDDIFEIKNA